MGKIPGVKFLINDYKEIGPSQLSDVGAVIWLTPLLLWLRAKIEPRMTAWAKTLMKKNAPKYKETYPEKYNEKVHKFGEICTKNLFHAAVTIWATIAFGKQLWWFGATHVLMEPQMESSYALKLYYIIQLAYHCHSLVAHFWEKRRDDHMEMLIHHIVTIAVVTISYCSQILLIGAVIFYIHDISDVIGSLTKASNYVQAPMYIRLTLYVSLLVTWFYYRIYLFSGVIVGIYRYAYDIGAMTSPIILSCAFCLTVLQMLHIYWWYLMVQIGYRLIQASSSSKDLTTTELDCTEHKKHE